MLSQGFRDKPEQETTIAPRKDQGDTAALVRVAPVSVIIATYGRPDALRNCLNAIATGDTLPHEVIVVDQSTDTDSARLCHNYSGTSSMVRHIPQSKRGMSVAQNEGFRQATQPIVAVTDDDCVPEADWITVIAKLLTDSSDIDGLTGRILPLPSEGAKRFPVATRVSTEPKMFRGNVAPWLVGSGNNFAVRHNLLMRIGGCDERLGPGAIGHGGADMDLFYRLLRDGAVMLYEPHLLVHHERQSYAGRRSRRAPYGYGMGACCGIYLRGRDIFALRMLATWFQFRAGRIFGGLRDMNVTSVREEIVIMGGTVAGLWFGLRQSPWDAPDMRHNPQ